MKKIIKLSFLLLALLGVTFTSCKKDYPEPPIQVLPIGTIYTIDAILGMESGTVFNEDASVYGIVTADEQSGNLYKAAFIQDRATGAALELYLNATSGVRIGDSIRVYLKDVTYTVYNGLPQLSNFEADGHIVILANDKPIQPAEATIADVVAGKYLAGLVKLSNVMFTEKNTFAEPTTYGNRTLVDPSDFSKTVIVRTSNYANFANDSLPQGTGSVVCIASLYGSTWQLLIRSAKELVFDGYNPGGGGGSSELPYYQDFASSFGTYTTYDVAGSQSWEIDYQTAKMTGYVNSVNYANEDWLISAPFSLEGVTQASMTMKYIARYFSNLSNDITIWVSSDYTSGDPTLATWTQVPASLSEGTNWTDFLTANIDLSQFAGQRVVVAVKYLSNDTKAGTIEIQSILIQEGGGDTPPGPGPNPSGEVQNIPYTQSFADEFGTYMTYDVLGAQSWMIDYHTAKMTGYVSSAYYANEDWLISSPVNLTGVNQAKMTMSYIGRYFSNINSEITIWASTDYVYGNAPSTATWRQIPATLQEGTNWTDFLTAEISLSSFAGQTATFAVKYTSTDNKAGTMEIQSITIEEGGGGTPPGPDPGPGGDTQSMPYSQSFATEFGSYTTYDVLGAQSWEIDYQTAKMTGYVSSTYYANEDWLISSPVAITGVNDAKMVMVYIGRYFNSINSEITILASTNYTWGGNPTSASWTQVPANLTESTNWNDFLTTEIALTDYVGQTVTFAVKYISTDSKAGTMEIQSITIQEGSAGGDTPPGPGPGPGPGGGSGTQDDPYNVASGIALQSEQPVAWVQGYIVGAVKNGNTSVNANDQINWSAPFDLATNVLIADDASCREITQCIIVNLPAGKPLRTEVNLVDHPENLGKVLAVNGKLRRYFGQAGLRDSNGTEEDFVLGDGGTPTPPPTPPQGIFTETFYNGQGQFAIQDVNLSGLDYVWTPLTNYHCMKANGYYQGPYETESWLVSPKIDLMGITAATLYFEHAVAFAPAQGSLFVMVSTNYNGDVTTATWTELNIGTWPTPNPAWVFESATADMSAFLGQQVTIAFKYTSTANACPAWELKNVVVE